MSVKQDPKRLLQMWFVEHKWIYIPSLISIIISEFITVQFPNVLGRFTDALQAHKLKVADIPHYALLLLMIAAGYVLFYGFGQYRNGQMGRRFEYELRRRLFDHWELLSTGYFRRRSIGDLLNHALNDVQNVREVMSMGLNIMTNAIFLLIATLIMTFETVGVKLTLVSIIPILFVPLFVIWIGPRVRGASRHVQEGLSDMAELTEESLSAIRLIKGTANEEIEARRFEARVDTIVERQMSLIRMSALFQAVFPFAESLSFAIGLLYAGYLAIHQLIPLGSFVAFTLYVAMLFNPLQQIGQFVNSFQRAQASITRLSILLSEEPDIRDAKHLIDVDKLCGDIRVELPAFSYPDGERPTLQQISFTVREGETLGIVGRTAAGKTTLVNLLPRIFDPPEGTVYIGGYDIHKVRLQTLREAIAYVPQDGFLFSTTVGENIGFGVADATPLQIEQAAKDACVYDDVMEFPQKFDTVIGERGVTLSGGQKQRTAIARAFLKEAPILILDDSLSAVDMNTEKAIISRLQEVRRNKTTLIIAHRLSAVRHADNILVLEEGRLVEQGTHEELLELGGIYKEMFSLQEQGASVDAAVS